jgi:hypothetical protein
MLGAVLSAADAPEPAAQVAVKEGPAYVAPKAPIHVVTAPEAEVYAAFLAQAWGQGKKDGPLARETLLLENDAVDSWQPGRRAWEKYLLKRVSGQGRAAEDLHAAFLKRPQEVIRFYGFPAVPMPVRLVRSDVLRAAFDKKGWDGFYDSYPNTQGVLTLSRACFNADSSEALFAAHLQCGKHCGYRDIVFMRKVNNEWTLIMKDALP